MKNEDLTPILRGDNSQSHACGFRVGRTYGHYRNCGTTAAADKLNDANYQRHYIRPDNGA